MPEFQNRVAIAYAFTFFHPSKLVGWENDNDELCQSQLGVRIPVYSAITGKSQRLNFDKIINYEDISEVLANEGEHFALLIKDDSMEPRMKENDVVIVRKQADNKKGIIKKETYIH